MSEETSPIPGRRPPHGRTGRLLAFVEAHAILIAAATMVAISAVHLMVGQA